MKDKTTEIAIWSTVENGVGVTAGCVATLRPLVSSALKKCGFRSGLDTKGTRGTDIPKVITRGNRISLNAMQFGHNPTHGTVTTITGQKGNSNHSRGSSEEPLANYPGKIGKTFYVETEESSIGQGNFPRISEDPYYPGR